MKQSLKSNRSLESFKIFPYIAWSVIILFAFLVYHTSVNLKSAAADLRAQTEFIQTQAHTDPALIKNFEKPSLKQEAPSL